MFLEFQTDLSGTLQIPSRARYSQGKEIICHARVFFQTFKLVFSTLQNHLNMPASLAWAFPKFRAPRLYPQLFEPMDHLGPVGRRLLCPTARPASGSSGPGPAPSDVSKPSRKIVCTWTQNHLSGERLSFGESYPIKAWYSRGLKTHDKRLRGRLLISAPRFMADRCQF